MTRLRVAIDGPGSSGKSSIQADGKFIMRGGFFGHHLTNWGGQLICHIAAERISNGSGQLSD